MTKLHDLYNKYGQSIWIDYIRRQFLEDGGMQAEIDRGVRGVTSNPSIFQKAIGNSDDYDDAIADLVRAGKSATEIYEALVIEDIQQATDLFRPVYDESNGADGYVSLEVSPTLARDTQGTIDEARRLYKAVDRPNVLIKVPATPEGIPAIQTLISEGININITLMFSLQDYDNVTEAYMSGLETLVENDGDPGQVASVASFFVSRVETDMDEALDEIGHAELRGQIAVANAKAAYRRFLEIFNPDNPRWLALANQGARVQRPLWASTSTKDESYSDVKYVDELIGAHTVNTAPPDTIDKFIDHGALAETLTVDLDQAVATIDQLKASGVDYDAITKNLQDVGVEKFADSFAGLMDSIQAKRDKIAGEFYSLSADLGDYQAAVDEALTQIGSDNIMRRIWEHDHTVWADDPTEISNRLGWLMIMEHVQSDLDRIHHLVHAVRTAGYTDVLLLGMGGSSLAPEVFSRVFGDQSDGLDLHVLDSTDPGYVRHYEQTLDITKTLFIVATKSGGTAETLSAFKYFYNLALAHYGDKTQAGQHFIGITDPHSKLESIGDRYRFRSVFLNDPNIGGRYSVLSFFGIVPAALIGLDVDLLLERANIMALNCDPQQCESEGDNLGGKLGAIMGELAKAGRDKLTFVLSPQIAPFADWAEQLIAESTGKNGIGILPVVGEPLGAPDVYGDDRVFVYLRLRDETTYDDAIAALVSDGYPVVTIQLDDLYDLGGQFFLWEMATAVAGYRLGIQPFDQPNVEAAKQSARAMIEAYEETGELPTLPVSIESNGIQVIGAVTADSPADALHAFLDHAQDGSYIALHAYVTPMDETTALLQDLQARLRDQTQMAVTVGYGPRFLHSTGQLHKGDAGKGLFIQITADMPTDLDIPDEAGADDSAMSFGTLKNAQALGDRQALLDENRHVLRLHLADQVAGLEALRDAVAT